MTSIEPPTSLLRPEDLPRVPLLDATPYLEDQTALVRVAGELGYLYLPGLLSGTLVDAVRAFVRGYAEAAGWVAPAPGNPPVFQAISGAGLDGRGWDDPCWVELQRLFRLEQSFIALATAPQLLMVLEVLYGAPARRRSCAPGRVELVTVQRVSNYRKRLQTSGYRLQERRSALLRTTRIPWKYVFLLPKPEV